MTSVDELLNALADAAGLLKANGEQGWADIMEESSRRVAQDSVAGAGDVKSLFGGAGSLNDLILHRNGMPLVQENDELEALRARIYAQTRSLVR